MGVIDDIIQKQLPTDQYFPLIHPKNQIVIHHTASGSAKGDIDWWGKTPDKIATAFVIDRDGKIYQCFASKYYAYHLGIEAKFLPKTMKMLAGNNMSRQKQSIGIELVSWGFLKQANGLFYTSTVKPKEVPAEEVITYEESFRGSRYYQKYTQEQINSLAELLKYMADKFKINTDYNHDMWDVSEAALRGLNGIWTHVSYRTDKSDCHPQPELIAMLKSLSS